MSRPGALWTRIKMLVNTRVPTEAQTANADLRGVSPMLRCGRYGERYLALMRA